jgi:hypothetical protein
MQGIPFVGSGSRPSTSVVVFSRSTGLRGLRAGMGKGLHGRAWQAPAVEFSKRSRKEPMFEIPKITLWYAIMLPGRKSGFRAGFQPDSSRESFRIGPAGRRADFEVFPIKIWTDLRLGARLGAKSTTIKSKRDGEGTASQSLVGSEHREFKTKPEGAHFEILHITKLCFRAENRTFGPDLGTPAGRKPAGGPTLRLSRVDSDRNPPREPDFRPEALLCNMGEPTTIEYRLFQWVRSDSSLSKLTGLTCPTWLAGVLDRASGPIFGRIPEGKTSKSLLRPAFGRPERRF